jgi:hypothetical protein
MDLNFFADPGLAPKPRSEIRVESLVVTAYPDGRRVRIEIELTPFVPSDRPNLEITASKPDGTLVGSVSIIEAAQRTLHLTMHLREQQPSGDYSFQADLYYGEESPQAAMTTDIQIPNNPIES